MTADELATAVGAEAANELASALAKIEHCLGQLTDEQVWWRSRPSLNSPSGLFLLPVAVAPDHGLRWILRILRVGLGQLTQEKA